MFRAWFHESPLWYRENAQTVPCVTAIGLSYKAHWDCKFALVGPCMIPEWPVNGDIMNDLFITEWKHWQSQSVLHQTLWAVSCNSSIFISVFSVEHASSGHFWPPLLGWFSCYFSEAVLCFQVYVLYVCFFFRLPFVLGRLLVIILQPSEKFVYIQVLIHLCPRYWLVDWNSPLEAAYSIKADNHTHFLCNYLPSFEHLYFYWFKLNPGLF